MREFEKQSLAKASDDALYGVAYGCGVNNGGTFFKITAAGLFTKLHDFTVGSQPYGGVVQGLVRREHLWNNLELG